MLVNLHVKNFGLIKETGLEFEPGLNVISGATGVGKSMLMGALDFLLGGRASADLIRTGEEQATVTGLFSVNPKLLPSDLCESLGLEVSNGQVEIQISRTLRQGGGRAYVGSAPVSVQTLKMLSEILVDVHSQFESQSLLRPGEQLRVLDEFGKVRPLRERFTSEYHSLKQKLEQLADLRRQAKERVEKLDFNKYQLKEIQDVGLKPGERAELEHQAQLLAHAEELKSACENAHEALYGADQSAVSVTETVANQLEDVSSLSPEIADSLKQIREATILLEESARSLKSLSERMVFDENLCNEVQERLEQIKKICRKYGPSEDDVLRAAEELKNKTDLLEKLEENTVQLEREVQDSLKKLDSAALELSASRAASGKKLSAKVLHELQELGMKEARFAAEVSFRKRGEADSENPLEMWSASGADTLEFLISPNPGEQLKPLRKIASGGELSRTMLGLMGILADVEGVPVLVFDEVDANIGGRLGTIIGEKLARLAQRRQILCITHLPQIAVYGAKHFRVVKNVRKGSTFTEVEPLSQEDRVQELSEMLRGEKASQTTVEQVLEMLSDAQKWHGKSPSAKSRK